MEAKPSVATAEESFTKKAVVTLSKVKQIQLAAEKESEKDLSQDPVSDIEYDEPGK